MERIFIIITPFGGAAFVAGWALLAIAAACGPRPPVVPDLRC